VEGSECGPLRYYSNSYLEREKKTTKPVSQDSQPLSRDTNFGLPKFEAEVQITEPRCSVRNARNNLLMPQ